MWLARLAPTPAARRSKKGDVGFVPSRQLAGGPGAVLRAVAAERAWQVVPGLLTFPDNVIALVRASASELGTLLSTSAVPSELHRARVTSEISGLDPLDQDEWVADLAGRIKAAEPDAAAVCVLDTGLMSAHPLLHASVDRALSALDGEGPGDQAGHGTAMAGLALFRDLDRDLIAKGVVALRHRIESVKVLRSNHDTTNVPEMYPTITATAIAAAEADQVRRRAFSMAVTVDGSDGSDGHPTSYSAAFDALAFGTDIARSDDGIELLGQPDPHAARLFVLSAGNVPADQWTTDHLALSDVAPVQNPAQAWNALTVGAYTEKVTPPTAELFRGWATVATTGELSPFSRTSMTFGRGWPIKPDIRAGRGEPASRSEWRSVRPARRRVPAHDEKRLIPPAHHSQRDERCHRAGRATRGDRDGAVPEPMAGDCAWPAGARGRMDACHAGALPCRRDQEGRTRPVAAALRLGRAHRGTGAQQRGQLGDAHPPGRVPAVRARQERRNHDARAPAP